MNPRLWLLILAFILPACVSKKKYDEAFINAAAEKSALESSLARAHMALMQNSAALSLSGSVRGLNTGTLSILPQPSGILDPSPLDQFFRNSISYATLINKLENALHEAGYVGESQLDAYKNRYRWFQLEKPSSGFAILTDPEIIDPDGIPISNPKKRWNIDVPPSYCAEGLWSFLKKAFLSNNLGRIQSFLFVLTPKGTLLETDPNIETLPESRRFTTRLVLNVFQNKYIESSDFELHVYLYIFYRDSRSGELKLQTGMSSQAVQDHLKSSQIIKFIRGD